ncbi:MAG: endonuclease/exonuclease/phosphatase family protein [Patescibacteria group bacterium]
MPVSIKLISLNIERSKHLDRIVPFLEAEKADVVCVQELLQHDASRIAAAIGAVDFIFTPMSRLKFGGVPGALYGTGTFLRIPVVARGEQYYVGQAGTIPESRATELLTYNDEYRAIAWVDVEKGGAVFRIATTHFTWTPDGSASDEQRRDMRELMRVLGTMESFVLAGDFNVPRGGEIFSMLSSAYTDNIPPQYKTSLDLTLHRAARERGHELENKMVDGLFSTPAYTVSGVRLVGGVSDHMAVVATVSKS